MDVGRLERGSKNAEGSSTEIMTKSSRRRGESKTGETQQSATVAVDTASVQLSEDGHVPKKDKAPRKLPKSDDGTTSDDDGRATRKLKKEKFANSERVEIKGKNAKKEKLKTEVFNEGSVDLHRGKTDNSENAKESDKRARKRKQKAEVGNSEDLQVENNSSKHGEDTTPDGKSKKKKRKKTGLESGGAFDQSAPKKKTEHVDMENRNAERKKLKAEVLNEDLHRGDADNPESAEEPDKRAKRRKQKAEVDNSEYLQVENDGSECVQDSTPDGKTKKKKRKKTRLENDGASNQSSPKKKTLQAGPSDEGEGKVAKAKKARKKKKNRKAPPEATKNTKDQCLQYLKDWQGPSWKFCKNKQLWLLSHAFEEDMIPEDDFEILLRYIEGLKGAARERLQQSANKFLEKANEDDDEDVDIDAGKYERARLVLQMLD